MRSSLKTRIAKAETLTGSGEPLPVIYIFITDSAEPEPGEPAGPVISDDTLAGFTPWSLGDTIMREPKESIDALKARVAATLPDCRGFMAVYQYQVERGSLTSQVER